MSVRGLSRRLDARPRATFVAAHDRIDPLFTMSDNLPPCDPSIEERQKLFTWTSDEHPAGGARRDRTDDLLLAKQALSQLSYGPSRHQ